MEIEGYLMTPEHSLLVTLYGDPSEDHGSVLESADETINLNEVIEWIDTMYLQHEWRYDKSKHVPFCEQLEVVFMVPTVDQIIAISGTAFDECEAFGISQTLGYFESTHLVPQRS